MSTTGPELKELPLSPGTFAYMQDTTKGSVKTYVGPTVINQTGQERPVKYDPERKIFTPCSLEQAVQPIIVAGEGDYVVLENPSKKTTEMSPPRGGVSQDMELNYGTRINIPGSASFALWPGQAANVIPGHNLHSNQYLLVRVYNEKAAKENWSKAKVITAVADSKEEGDVVATKKAEDLDLSMGKLLIIKGTEVSFYIPPTGVEVVPDDDGQYVREALTLERLEDCVLIDENGSKRYENGPQVVFPKPTESFLTQNGSRKFKAIDLNEISGLHIKVIAAYKEGGKEYAEGDEIFITGKECPIYHPRPEHSVIKYGDREKHYATAIPPGEGRYIMDRKKGTFDMVEGPTMCLPNPVNQVFVRRVLTDDQCRLWYPGNVEALGYNQKLRSASITDQGYVEEKSVVTAALYSSVASRGLPDTISRGTSHTKPRELTLDTKYEGVPLIGVWTGYAVMVVDKSGNRRVELGPKTIRLKWDETLEVLSLSTGKPKNTDTLERTVYLRTKNNKVSDVIDVETKDHVPLAIKLSFRVNFLEETNEKWFEVDNYVKLLCDHVRSMLKGMVRKQEVETFYSDGTAIVRDFLLGKSTEGERKGLAFPECGIVVEDVEVLAIEIKDGSVAQMLNDTQRKMVAANIRLNEAERDLTITRKSEEFTRQKAHEAWKTKELILTLEIAKSQKESEVALSAIDAAIAQQQEELKNIEAQQAALDAKIAGELSREKSKQEQHLTFLERQAKGRLEELKAETESCVQRLQAAQSGFSEALLALGSQETLTKVFEAGSIQRYIGGDSVVDALKKVFAGTTLADTIEQHVGRLGNVSIPNPRK